MTLQISDEHRRILNATGHALVVGGPGSGKTTLALLKAGQRIDTGLLLGESVLFLSFSRAAIVRVAEGAQVELSASARARLGMQTFHSFFWEILKAHGYLLGAPTQLCLLLPHDERVLKRTSGATWRQEQERLFQEEGRVTFDLFAPKTLALLRGSATIRRLTNARFPLIIVDESQDTAEAQWECVRELAAGSQVICLADLQQQIYDWQPDVSSERVTEIMTALVPVRADLATGNHRSPGRDIIAFGDDILNGTPRQGPYVGVSRVQLPPAAAHRDATIRRSVGIIRQRIKAETGEQAGSLAVLTTWNKGVGVVSRALAGNSERSEIPHMMLTDEAQVVLASRLVAFLLEPLQGHTENARVAIALEIMAEALDARDAVTHQQRAARLRREAERLRRGAEPNRRGTGHALREVIRGPLSEPFSGVPGKDWLKVRDALKAPANAALTDLAADAAQLATLGRGRRIASGLADAWQSRGSYTRAREVLEAAVTEDYLLGERIEWRGITVMTVHKAKGKEYDGVIVLDEPRSCPLTLVGDTAPFARSRRLLRVGVTRARSHVLLLTDPIAPSPILSGFHL